MSIFLDLRQVVSIFLTLVIGDTYLNSKELLQLFLRRILFIRTKKIVNTFSVISTVSLLELRYVSEIQNRSLKVCLLF